MSQCSTDVPLFPPAVALITVLLHCVFPLNHFIWYGMDSLFSLERSHPVVLGNQRGLNPTPLSHMKGTQAPWSLSRALPASSSGCAQGCFLHLATMPSPHSLPHVDYFHAPGASMPASWVQAILWSLHLLALLSARVCSQQ